MIENTNTKQFYPGPILNNTLEITDFLFNDAEQIKIKHSKLNEEGILVDVDLNYPTDYEVTKVLPSDINAAEAALTASTGQVMLKNVNVSAGEKLTVYRVSQIIQDKDYPRTGAFPAATHEGALDYLTMQNQEQKDEIDRALKVPISTQNFEGSLPLPIPSRALKINNDGTGFEMSEFDPDLALVTTEEFKNQSQQAAAAAEASEIAAANSAAGAKASENVATNKASEVVELGTTAVNNINEAYNFVNEWFSKLNAIPYIPVGTILPTTGAIDESLGYQRYANGQLIANVSSQAPDLVKFLEFQETHAPNLLCSETEWQTALTLSTLGQVGKYVWNKEEDSVRIPRIVNIQGMMDMNNVGNMIEAGLPLPEGDFLAYSGAGVNAWGILKQTTSVSTKAIGSGTGNGMQHFEFTPNGLYGNSDTVQEESILYPYVLQIATGVQYKTPVQNELMSNNPFFFGYYQFFEVAPNNISWLKSAAQWNNATTHGDYYNWLAEERVNPRDIPVRANVTKVGNVIENDGVLSGFTTSSYAYIPNGKQNNNAEYVIKFTIGSTLTTSQVIFHSEEFVNIETNANGQIYSYSWGDGSHNIIINNPTPNTTYWIKIVVNGNSKTFSYSTNGVTYTEAVSFVDSGLNVSAGYQLCFGINTNAYVNPFLGTIDLNESYINVNGQRWWSGMKSKVRLHTEDYDDYDWVINPGDQTFRLPLKVLGASGSAVVGNGGSIGFISPALNIPDIAGLNLAASGATAQFSNYTAALSRGDDVGITTDPTKSGIETSTQGLSLYFYVGGIAKNEHIVDVGRIEEKVDTLIPDNRLVWDGQWQGFTNDVTLLQNAGAGSYNFDLSQYLPNDNNPYELLCGVLTYGDTYIGFESNGIRTGNTHGGGQSVIQQVIVPVGATKQLIVNVMTGTSANASVSINNYRRLGTNI